MKNEKKKKLRGETRWRAAEMRDESKKRGGKEKNKYEAFWRVAKMRGER